jgi:hypothetical protein
MLSKGNPSRRPSKMLNMLMTSSNAIKIRKLQKTQTRRCQGLESVNWYPGEWVIDEDLMDSHPEYKDSNWFALWNQGTKTSFIAKPRYQVGDIVGIREAHYLYGFWTRTSDNKWRFVYYSKDGVYYTDNPPKGDIVKGIVEQEGWYLRPGLFMHDQHIRTHVKIKEVRCQHVREISETDAIAEGATLYFGIKNPEQFGHWQSYNVAFGHLWDSINGKPKKNKPDLSWGANPWDFAYSFEIAEVS